MPPERKKSCHVPLSPKHAAGKPVSLRVAEGEAGTLTLTVESAGRGALPRRPFARFVRGARARGEGMGVGLWLVDAIAKANGGSFTFRRTPRGGVRAVVTLASS